MAQLSGTRVVRWSTRIGLGGGAYISFHVYKKLTGVLLRCPKCEQMSSILYYGYLGYFVKCSSCHEQTFLRKDLRHDPDAGRAIRAFWPGANQPSVRELLSEVLPASDVKDITHDRPPWHRPRRAARG